MEENSSVVERWFPKPKVKGSNPFFLDFFKNIITEIIQYIF